MSTIKRKAPSVYEDSDGSSTDGDTEEITIEELKNLPETQDEDFLKSKRVKLPESNSETDGIVSDHIIPALDCLQDFVTILIQCFLMFDSLDEAISSMFTYVLTSKKGANTGILNILDHIQKLLADTSIEKLPMQLWNQKDKISRIVSTHTTNTKSVIHLLKGFSKKYSKEGNQGSLSCSTSKKLKMQENTSILSIAATDLTDSVDAPSGGSSIMHLGLPNTNQLQGLIQERTGKISSTIFVSNKEGSASYTYIDPDPKNYIVQLQIFPTKQIALEEKKNWWKSRIRQHLFHVDLENNQDPRSRYLQRLIEEEHNYLDNLRKRGTHIEESIRSKLL